MPLNDVRQLNGEVYPKDELYFDRDYRILAQIANIEGESEMPEEGLEAVVKTWPLPPSVQVYINIDDKFQLTRENPYGNEMVYATAIEMKKIKAPQDVSPHNKAILAYLKALEDNIPIILEWH